MIELNKIYNQDCLEGLMKIPEKTINLIVIDPPYNIGIAEWDKIYNYIEWMGKVFKECERVLKENGSFYFWHNDFLQIVELQNWINQNTKFIFKRLLIWDKFNGTKAGHRGRNAKYANQRNWAKCAEYCLFYTFQKDSLNVIKSSKGLWTNIKNYMREEKKKSGLTLLEINQLFGINIADGIAKRYFGDSQWELPTKEKYEILQKTGYFKKPYEELKEEYEKLRKEYESKRYTFNNLSLPSVLQHPPISQNGHITPKPVKLIEELILTSSNEGDVILDCFMGSGTTAIACINLHRNYIGFELDKEYHRLAEERIHSIV